MGKILLVEDEVVVRFIVAQWLRGDDFDVVEAKTGEEAAAILSSTPDIDLVFADVRTPGKVNGFKLAEFTRQKFPEIPVVLASADPPRINPEDMGVSAFFRKPYDITELSRTLANLVPQRNSPMRMENGLNQLRHE